MDAGNDKETMSAQVVSESEDDDEVMESRVSCLLDNFHSEEIVLVEDSKPETAEPSGGVSCLLDNFLSQEMVLAEDSEPETTEPSGGVSCLLDNFLSQEMVLAADCEPETAEPSGGVSCLLDNFLSQEIAMAEDCEPEPEMTVFEEDRYDSQPLLKSSPMPPNKLVIIPTDIDIIETAGGPVGLAPRQGVDHGVARHPQ